MASDKPSVKTVVITGASSGIGFDTAKLLLKEGGYRLVLVGKNRDKLESAARELVAPIEGKSEARDAVSTVVCDLNDLAQVKKTVEKISTSYKNIYGLVNNAGVYPFGGAITTDEKTWDLAFNVNLKAAFFFIQGLVPAMARNPDGGRIVNVSSTAGVLPNHFALAYSVSKAAMIQMSKTLAKELGKDNITVNCVCPGIVRSPLHEAYHANTSSLEEFYAKRGSTFPLGRVGVPEDVAGPIRFFLSKEAAWVTGDTFIVDGGRLLL